MEPAYLIARRTDLAPESGLAQPARGAGFTAAEQVMRAYVAAHPDRAEEVQIVAAPDVEDAA